MFYDKITIYPPAITIFHAPSDISGIGGMHQECICAMKSWQKGPGYYDMIFINTNPSVEGMWRLDVAHVQLFFSFTHDGIKYHCALVHWFSWVGNSPDDHTGMWVIEPDMLGDGETFTLIIHLNTIIQASHLIPVFGFQCVSKTLSFTDTLDKFTSFYINKYVNHHAFEIAF
jgi:hypothetical protein